MTKLKENAIIPTYAHVDDAGMDLYAVEQVYLPAMSRAVVSTGISMAIPEGFVGLIHPRSGMALSKGITVLNAPGTIDSGYRGEIKVILYNSTKRNNYTINPGDRIAQLVIQPYYRASIVMDDVLPVALRGHNGFGSTGL